MARIEKTVFISYRRADVYTALAVYENLKNQGYDVFFDYRSISSGDFEQIITGNIRARAHFLLILTPTALDRCNEPGDWLRREIETAIDEQRNIVPLLFRGFRFGDPSVAEKLTGKLKNVGRYNGLNVHEDYFEEAMHRLRTQYLNIPLNTVLHPVSTEVRKVVREEQLAADKALEQIEDVKELVGQKEEKSLGSVYAVVEKTELEILESQAIQYELKGDLWNALQTYHKIKQIDPFFPRVHIKISELEKEWSSKRVPLEIPRRQNQIPLRLVGFVVGGLLVIAFLIWGTSKLLQNSPAITPELTHAFQTNVTFTSQPGKTNTPEAIFILPAPTLTPGVGSTIVAEKDSMTLVYVPAGKFNMGSDHDDSDEKPVHTVTLDAFWIDQTEVTNAMYAKCVEAGVCKEPISKTSNTRASYYSNSEFDNYPVIYVDWNMAKTYCEWVGRRLPTEAEWEKAARGESAFVYPWGNDFDGTKVNFCDKNCPLDEADKSSDDGFAETAPVGSYPNGASPYGALDMAGNVWEWVNDWYDVYPGGDPNASSDFGQNFRVQRGGTFYNDAGNVRSATRWASVPTFSENIVGFRCAVSETEQASLIPSPQTILTQTLTPDIGSTMTGKDGMTLLYIPAGEFTMGSESYDNEKPIHTVDLDAFWIDQTEVTNAFKAEVVIGQGLPNLFHAVVIMANLILITIL